MPAFLYVPGFGDQKMWHRAGSYVWETRRESKWPAVLYVREGARHHHSRGERDGTHPFHSPNTATPAVSITIRLRIPVRWGLSSLE